MTLESIWSRAGSPRTLMFQKSENPGADAWWNVLFSQQGNMINSEGLLKPGFFACLNMMGVMVVA